VCHVVHAQWEPGTGLLLWSADPQLLARATEALGRRRPRHRVTVAAAVAAAAGCAQTGPGPVTMPATALAPDAVLDLAAQIPDEVTAAPDLETVRTLTGHVGTWVRAGLVAPGLHRLDGDWFPRWTLLGTRDQRLWRTEWLAALPTAVLPPGADRAGAFDDLVAGLADAHVRRLLGEAGPVSDDPLTAVLLSDEGMADEPGARIAAALDDWRAGVTAAEPDLVLRLLPPAGGDDAAASTEALWRLQLCARGTTVAGADEAPTPLDPAVTDPQVIERVLHEFSAATEAYPLLAGLPRDDTGFGLLLPIEAVTDLIDHGARALTEAGVTVLLPRIMKTADPSLRVTVRSADDDGGGEHESVLGTERLLEFDLRLAVGDLELGPAQIRDLVEAGGGLVRLRGRWVRADDRTLAAAARYLAAQAGEPATVARLMAMVATDPPPVPITEIDADGWVRGLLDGRALTAAPDAGPDAPAGLAARLRPYQLAGLRWLDFMAEHRLGAILADDMGLGKTVQILALLVHRADRRRRHGPALVVCPMSVVGNWQRETARFAPGLRVHVHHGPDRPRGAELAARAGEVDVVLTTYGLLSRDIEALTGIEFAQLVLDEAQQVKNPRTAAARAARRIRARHRIAVTGTPVENRLGELWAIMDVVNPGLLGTRNRFRAALEKPISAGADPDAIGRLHRAIGPFLLRRLKTDPQVAADLPAKHEMTARVNLTAEQAGLYRAVLDDLQTRLASAEGMARKGAVLTALLHLKQVCNHPAQYLGDGSAVAFRGRHRSGKLAWLEDVLEQVLGGGERILLFTQFRAFGDLLVPWLTERFAAEPVPFLHGGVSRRARDEMVARFQAGEGPPIMVLSVLAGGTGITLTAANHVVHLDRWWNPAVEAQATDRAYRIGQDRDVQVRRLLTVETVEERIDESIGDKRRLADLAVTAGEQWVTELGDEELMALLSLGAGAVGE